MRKYIDILNESVTIPVPTVVLQETEMLEEGVRETVEAVADKVLKMFSPKHVSYEAACNAIDRINALTHGKGYVSYTKDQLLVGGQLVKDAAATVVGVSLTLNQLVGLGVPLTAAITAAATAIVTGGLAHQVSGKRALVTSQVARHEGRSPAPVADDPVYEAVMSNIAGMRKK